MNYQQGQQGKWQRDIRPGQPKTEAQDTKLIVPGPQKTSTQPDPFCKTMSHHVKLCGHLDYFKRFKTSSSCLSIIDCGMNEPAIVTFDCYSNLQDIQTQNCRRLAESVTEFNGKRAHLASASLLENVISPLAAPLNTRDPYKNMAKPEA